MAVKRLFAVASLCLWLALLVSVVQPSMAQEPDSTPFDKEHASHPHAMSDEVIGGWENGPHQTPEGLWYMPEDASPRMDMAGLAPQDTGGPDDFGYTWDDSVPLNWVDASGGMDTGIDANNYGSGPIDIGFSFKYYENTYEQLYVSRHGFLAFSDQFLDNRQSEIPSPEKPDDVIAPHWIPSRDVDYVRYLKGGATPNRWIAVEWNQLEGYLNGVSEYTFEAILHESGDIEFQYGTIDYNPNGNRWCESSGIEDSTGLDGLKITEFCRMIGGHHAVHIYRPAPSARVGISLLYQGTFTRAGDINTFHSTIRNNGEFGTDTYDITQNSSWTAMLYHADGITPLSDTNGDGNVDTGPVEQGQNKNIIVKVQTPTGATVGASNEVALTVRSALNSNRTKTVSLQTTVPTFFAQVYRDDADGAMSIDYIGPDARINRKATDNWHWGYDVAVTELENKNFLYAWTKSRRLDNDVWVREIEYVILGPTGEFIQPLTRLTDLSDATVLTYDYDPAVDVTPDGRIGILWYRYRYNGINDTRNYNIHFATLDADGDLVSGPKNITENDEWGGWNDLHVPSMSNPQIAATDENHFILAWSQFHYGDPNSHCSSNCVVLDIWYALRRSSGSEKKEPTKLTNDTPGWEDGFYDPALASTNGRHALLTFGRNGYDIHYAVIHSQGHVVKDMTNLSQDDDDSSDWESDAVQLSNGNIVVAWRGGRYPKYDMRFAVLDEDYNRIVAPTVLLNAAAVMGNGYVSVAADEQGRAALTWMDYDYDYRRNLYYALVDGFGSVLTPASIFRTSQRNAPYIETSFQGYGNTSYNWRPAGVDASLIVSDETVQTTPESFTGFGIQYANQGATATGVTLTMTLVPHLSYHADSSGITPTINGNMVTWHLPNLRLLEERELLLRLRVTGGMAGEVLPVHLELRSSEPDLNPDDNVASVQVKIAKPLNSGIDVLNISSAEPYTLDPARADNTASIQMINQLFAGLTRLDQTTSEPLPDLATSWEMSPDGKTFTFTLRDDATWSDGTPVTAEHVRYGILRSLDPVIGSNWGAYLLSIIKNAQDYRSGDITDPSQVGVIALDESHIRFELEKPAAYFPSITSMWVARPMPEWVVNTWGDDWTDPDHIVTSGPYLLDERVDYTYILLSKNPDFYNVNDVSIEKVNVHIVDDVYDAWNMYQTGDLDTVNVPTDELDTVRADLILNQQLNEQPQACNYYYGFSTSQPPFDNPLVRKAFSAATDRRGVVKDILKGLQQSALTLTPRGVFGYVDGYIEGVGHPFNVGQAKQWLADAGYPNGQGLPPITLWHNTSDGNQAIAEYVIQRWQEVLGVTVERRDLSWQDYHSFIDSGEAQIWRLGWCADYNDAYSFLYESISRDRHGGWMNVDYDNLLEQAMMTSDPSVRQNLYRQAEEILVETDTVAIPTHHFAYGVLTQPYLHRTYGVSGEFYFPDWQITRVATTVDADGGSITSYAGDITIDIPTGAFVEAVELVLSPAYGMPAPAGLTGIGQIFEIETTHVGSGEPAQLEPGHSYDLSVQYASSIPAHEETLALHHWSGDHWVLEPTSSRHPDTNIITAMPDHFSTWAIMGTGPSLYLPVLLK